MKVAIVVPDGLSVVLFCKGIISILKKNIKGVDVFVISDNGTYKKDIEACGVRSISVPMYRFMNPLRDIKYLIGLYKIFKTEKFDEVINFSTKPNIYGTFAARLAGVKKIVSHVVGLGSAFLPTDNIRTKLVRYIFLRLYHLACKFSDKVWFTNENDLSCFLSKKMVTQEKVILT